MKLRRSKEKIDGTEVSFLLKKNKFYIINLRYHHQPEEVLHLPCGCKFHVVFMLTRRLNIFSSSVGPDIRLFSHFS